MEKIVLGILIFLLFITGCAQSQSGISASAVSDIKTSPLESTFILSSGVFENDDYIYKIVE